MTREDWIRSAAAKAARGKLREWFTYDDDLRYGPGFWDRTIAMHLQNTRARAAELGLSEAQWNDAIVDKILVDGRGRAKSYVGGGR